MFMPSTPSRVMSSKKRRNSSGSSPLKTVVLVITWKPRALAERMAETAPRQTPSRQTTRSWTRSGPSRWTLNSSWEEGRNLPSSRSSRIAFVHRITKRPRAMRPLTIRSIWGWTSGSPPATETMGAPHSSAASQHSSGVSRFFITSAGNWILPQPAHSKLQARSGSSIRTRG